MDYSLYEKVQKVYLKPIVSYQEVTQHIYRASLERDKTSARSDVDHHLGQLLAFFFCIIMDGINERVCLI